MRMEIQLFNGETEQLVDLLCYNEWPYHSNNQLDKLAVEQAIGNGYYTNNRETFWVSFKRQKIGILMIEDIEDTIPLFDIRLSKHARGKSIGSQALLWLQDYLFGEKEKIRIEGYTRADNLPMRKCFTKANFVKEGYLRSAWENTDGTISDSVLYAAIYEDWQTKKVTPIKIHDIPF